MYIIVCWRDVGGIEHRKECDTLSMAEAWCDMLENAGLLCWLE